MDMQIVFWVVVALTVASGSAATLLVALPGQSMARTKIADRLGKVALCGMAAIVALLGGAR